MAAALWIVVGVCYLVAEAVVAAHLSGYSYSADYISDLGQPLRSPMAAWMNGAFIAQGLAFAMGAALMAAAVRRSAGSTAYLGLALTYGVGSVVVGVFPSGGTGTPALAHVGGAVAAILAGNLAILTAGVVLLRRRQFRAIGVTGVALGVVGLISGAMLVAGSALGADVYFGDGAWERAAIYTIIGWQLVAGIALALRQSAHSADSGPAPTALP
ncbi:MAG: DUF998 domain-containing protein [Dietzia sp.]|nr:DUF998 domain-containing protein [Dietzia sp.]